MTRQEVCIQNATDSQESSRGRPGGSGVSEKTAAIRAALSILMALPVVVLFLTLQRYLLRGLLIGNLTE